MFLSSKLLSLLATALLVDFSAALTSSASASASNATLVTGLRGARPQKQQEEPERERHLWAPPWDAFYFGGTKFQKHVRANVLKQARRFKNRSPFRFSRGRLDVDANDSYWVKKSSGSLVSRRGVRPSDAINYALNNPGVLTLDCTAGSNFLMFKAELDTLGAYRFNRRHNWKMQIGWEHWFSRKESFGLYKRYANGEPQAGFQTRNGDLAIFDPKKGDVLIPGNGHYFDKPGDTSSFLQGWSALYLGAKADGETFRFWVHPGGETATRFNYPYIPTNGPFDGDYLSSLHAFPLRNGYKF